MSAQSTFLETLLVLNFVPSLLPCLHRHILDNKYITSHCSHQLTLDGEENELAGWCVYISNQKVSLNS